MKNIFTEEEIKAAKATRDFIIEDNTDELKSIYMAGEIVMWDECNNNRYNIQETPSSFLIEGEPIKGHNAMITMVSLTDKIKAIEERIKELESYSWGNTMDERKQLNWVLSLLKETE